MWSNIASNDLALIKTRKKVEITSKNMVSIYTKPLPQIILTDFDAECDQVLFSVKKTQNMDHVSVKQSQKPSYKICKIEIVLPGTVFLMRNKVLMFVTIKTKMKIKRIKQHLPILERKNHLADRR